MDTYQLIKDCIAVHKYQIVEEEGSCIVFRYQMNLMQIWAKENNDHFISIVLPNFAEVTDDNLSDVIMKCHKLNADVKQVKLYTYNNMILAAAEIYYQNEDDIDFQMQIALKNLILAKVQYYRLERHI